MGGHDHPVIVDSELVPLPGIAVEEPSPGLFAVEGIGGRARNAERDSRLLRHRLHLAVTQFGGLHVAQIVRDHAELRLNWIL